MQWFTVRTVVHRADERVYEERITLWRRNDADEAAEAALSESAEYAGDEGAVDCGLAQVYEPYGDDVAGLRSAADGCEIFSLARQSDLPPGEFRAWCIEPTARIVRELRQRHPRVPVICFPRGAGIGYAAFAEAVRPAALGLDTSVPIGWAAQALPSGICLRSMRC